MTVSEGQPPLPGPTGTWPEGGGPEPRWPASAGLLGLLLALLAVNVLFAVVYVFYIAAGVDEPTDAASFDFVAIAVQSAVFIGAALVMTERLGRPGVRDFGFRPFKPSALLWALGGFIVFIVLSAIYVSIVQPPKDDLPQQLGADESTLLAVITGVFVIAVAPPVEEFFFRGFLYQSLRTRLGVWGGALTSGLIFGAIHLKFEFLIPLAILGTILALLFQRTGSLWPCILVHAANNALAFAVTV
jgi:membrane protease YdiL (CAAX protease family)